MLQGPPRLNHLRRGSGEPLLLLHSLGVDLIVWSPLLELLAPHRDVVVVDMPGFGKSPPLPDELAPTAENLARAVVSFWDSLDTDGDPHVAGLSLGGWVAIECAKLGRARSVTGICTAGFWKQPLSPRRNVARASARGLKPLIPLLRSRPVRRAAMGRVIHHPERVPAADAVHLARAYASAPDYTRASAEMRAGMVTGLDELRVPLTLAWGEHDTLVRRRPVRGLPDSVRQLVLPGCGHIPTWDDPELVSRVVLEGSRGPSSVTRRPQSPSRFQPNLTRTEERG